MHIGAHNEIDRQTCPILALFGHRIRGSRQKTGMHRGDQAGQLAEYFDTQDQRKVAAMFSKLKTFFAKEEGAVTVDYVVLTAAVVGLGVYGVGAVQAGVANLAVALEQGISTAAVDNGS